MYKSTRKCFIVLKITQVIYQIKVVNSDIPHTVLAMVNDWPSAFCIYHALLNRNFEGLPSSAVLVRCL